MPSRNPVLLLAWASAVAAAAMADANLDGSRPHLRNRDGAPGADGAPLVLYNQSAAEVFQTLEETEFKLSEMEVHQQPSESMTPARARPPLRQCPLRADAASLGP